MTTRNPWQILKRRQNTLSMKSLYWVGLIGSDSRIKNAKRLCSWERLRRSQRKNKNNTSFQQRKPQKLLKVGSHSISGRCLKSRRQRRPNRGMRWRGKNRFKEKCLESINCPKRSEPSSIDEAEHYFSF